MEPPAQISCSGNCLIHLHSAAGKASLDRQACGLTQHVGPDGITRFLVSTGNNEPKFLSAQEIRIIRFQMLLAEFEQQNGCPVRDLIAIIPAVNNNPRQYLSEIYAAANAAGARIVASMGRSLVAACSYNSVTPGRRKVLVFELGGHFFEITLFADNVQSVDVSAVVSDFGCPLFNKVVSKLQSRLGNSITSDGDTLLQILTECERAKNALCSGSSIEEIKFNLLGREERLQINRERLVLGNLKHIRRGIIRCLMEAGVSREAVDEVVLVGASTNIPEVRQILREFFQAQPFRCSIDPANVIDVGSKRYMEMFSNRFNITVAGFLAFNLGIHAL